jgi:hypothetical protein
LQVKLSLKQGRVVDLKSFQTLSLEIHIKMGTEQQQLISKIEIIQHYFQEVSIFLDDIGSLEKEAKAARNAFQKADTCLGNREAPIDLKLSVTE